MKRVHKNYSISIDQENGKDADHFEWYEHETLTGDPSNESLVAEFMRQIPRAVVAGYGVAHFNLDSVQQPTEYDIEAITNDLIRVYNAAEDVNPWRALALHVLYGALTSLKIHLFRAKPITDEQVDELAEELCNLAAELPDCIIYFPWSNATPSAERVWRDVARRVLEQRQIANQIMLGMFTAEELRLLTFYRSVVKSGSQSIHANLARMIVKIADMLGIGGEDGP